MNFPELPGLTLLYSLIGSPEFRGISGISLEKVFGVPKSHCRGKMKWICRAAVRNSSKIQEIQVKVK